MPEMFDLIADNSNLEQYYAYRWKSNSDFMHAYEASKKHWGGGTMHDSVKLTLKSRCDKMKWKCACLLSTGAGMCLIRQTKMTFFQASDRLSRIEHPEGGCGWKKT